MRNFLNKYKHIWTLLYAFIYLPWFCYLEKNVTKNFNIIHMKIDDIIPFCEYFIIPYLLWFFYVGIVLFYLFLKDIPNYYKNCLFLFTGMTIFLIISTIYPNGHTLRPIIFENENIFTIMVKNLYVTDTCTNIFPSIHVYNSIGAHLGVISNKTLKKNKKIICFSTLLMISIILSTMFLKQHSFFDVITALALSLLMYLIVYKVEFKLLKKKIKFKIA